VFRLIYERFGGHVPTADDPITAYLIRELGFSKRGADECLNSLRKTLRTLEELTGDTGFESDDQSEATDSPERGEANVEPQESKSPAPTDFQSASNTGEFIRIRLTRECIAELRFDGRVTERAIANLMRHIELMAEVWAMEDDE
jgi:hypothetical protein